MKICCISDLHGTLPQIEQCDLLLIAGDVCGHHGLCVGDSDDIFGQSQWLYHQFNDWLNAIPAKDVVMTFGNHDWVAEKKPEMVPKNLRAQILTDSSVEVQGLKIWGSPFQMWFWDWAFNAPDGPEGEIFLAKKWVTIPDDTDILLIHGPPFGYGDKTAEGDRTGSKTLTERIFALKPKLSVHGHIHEDRGVWRFERANLSDGIICNASVLDRNYQLVNEPLVFEI